MARLDYLPVGVILRHDGSGSAAITTSSTTREHGWSSCLDVDGPLAPTVQSNRATNSILPTMLRLNSARLPLGSNTPGLSGPPIG